MLVAVPSKSSKRNIFGPQVVLLRFGPSPTQGLVVLYIAPHLQGHPHTQWEHLPGKTTIRSRRHGFCSDILNLPDFFGKQPKIHRFWITSKKKSRETHSKLWIIAPWKFMVFIYIYIYISISNQPDTKRLQRTVPSTSPPSTSSSGSSAERTCTAAHSHKRRMKRRLALQQINAIDAHLSKE